MTKREGTLPSMKEKGRKGKSLCLSAPREKLEYSKSKGISKRRYVINNFLKILLYLSDILGFGDWFHKVLSFIALAQNGFYSGIALCCGQCCYNSNGISGWYRPSPLGKFSHSSCYYCRELQGSCPCCPVHHSRIFPSQVEHGSVFAKEFGVLWFFSRGAPGNHCPPPRVRIPSLGT